MTGAFDHIRVLDFTTTIAGPHCGRLLADLGAEVIKIEAPEGDMMRSRPPLRDGASTSFGQLNAGKQSIVLDLKSPQGAEAARRQPVSPHKRLREEQRHTNAGISRSTHTQQLLLIDFDDLGPMIKALDLPMVVDRAGETPGSTVLANRSQ